VDDRGVRPEGDEFGATQPERADDLEPGSSAGELKDLLGEVDGDGGDTGSSGRRLHGELLLVDCALNIDTSKLGTPMPHAPREESIPSLKRSDNGMSRWPLGAGPSAHSALAVQRVLPLSPASLERSASNLNNIHRWVAASRVQWGVFRQLGLLVPWVLRAGRLGPHSAASASRVVGRACVARLSGLRFRHRFGFGFQARRRGACPTTSLAVHLHPHQHSLPELGAGSSLV